MVAAEEEQLAEQLAEADLDERAHLDLEEELDSEVSADAPCTALR
jgi:hypothetical protein